MSFRLCFRLIPSLPHTQDGCRLLAVQNSEYLCYLTLCLSHLYGASLGLRYGVSVNHLYITPSLLLIPFLHTHIPPSPAHTLYCHCFTDVHPLHLPDISPELVDLCTCLNSLHTELNWSNEFHKNQYFGEGTRGPMTIPPSPLLPLLSHHHSPRQVIHQKGTNPPITPTRKMFMNCLVSLKIYTVLT